MQVCSLMTFGVINAEHVGGTNDLLWSVWTQLQASTELHSSTSRRKWENNTENVCVGVHVCVNNVTLMGLRCQQDVTPCPLQREHVCMYKLFGVQTQSIPIQNKYIKIELLLLHSNFITWHTPGIHLKQSLVSSYYHSQMISAALWHNSYTSDISLMYAHNSKQSTLLSS